MDTQAGEGLPINPTNPGSSTRGKGGAAAGAARMLEQGRAGRQRGATQSRKRPGNRRKRNDPESRHGRTRGDGGRPKADG